MTQRDRAGNPPGQRAGQRAGRREAAGPVGHGQGFPTPAPIRPLPVRPLPVRPLPVRPLPVRPLPVRLRDRNGGFPRLSGGP